MFQRQGNVLVMCHLGDKHKFKYNFMYHELVDGADIELRVKVLLTCFSQSIQRSLSQDSLNPKKM